MKASFISIPIRIRIRISGALVAILATTTTTTACDKTVPTPADTTLLDRPTISKLSVTDWSAGAPKGPLTKVAKTYRYDPGSSLGSPVRFTVSFEHGPVELVTASNKPDKPPSLLAPRAIKIVVVENKAWAMSATCEDDLAVPLAVNPDGTSAYPKSVWARCTVKMARKNGDISIAPHIEIHGTGEINATALGKDEKLVAE